MLLASEVGNADEPSSLEVRVAVPFSPRRVEVGAPVSEDESEGKEEIDCVAFTPPLAQDEVADGEWSLCPDAVLDVPLLPSSVHELVGAPVASLSLAEAVLLVLVLSSDSLLLAEALDEELEPDFDAELPEALAVPDVRALPEALSVDDPPDTPELTKLSILEVTDPAADVMGSRIPPEELELPEEEEDGASGCRIELLELDPELLGSPWLDPLEGRASSELEAGAEDGAAGDDDELGDAVVVGSDACELAGDAADRDELEGAAGAEDADSLEAEDDGAPTEAETLLDDDAAGAGSSFELLLTLVTGSSGAAEDDEEVAGTSTETDELVGADEGWGASDAELELEDDEAAGGADEEGVDVTVASSLLEEVELVAGMSTLTLSEEVEELGSGSFVELDDVVSGSLEDEDGEEEVEEDDDVAGISTETWLSCGEDELLELDFSSDDEEGGGDGEGEEEEVELQELVDVELSGALEEEE